VSGGDAGFIPVRISMMFWAASMLLLSDFAPGSSGADRFVDLFGAQLAIDFCPGRLLSS
jgi:hypothetical protein